MKIVKAKLIDVNMKECQSCHYEAEECDRCGADISEQKEVFCDSDSLEHYCDKCAEKMK